MASAAAHITETTPLLSSFDPSAQEQADSKNALDSNVGLVLETTWKTESQLLVGYSAPLICTYLLQYFYNLVIILVVSHLGTDELAAVSLGITTMNITGFAVFEGMATSLDTLCAQAYGSVLLLLYIRFAAPWTLQCWPGFTSAAFRNWSSMVKLSFAGAIMTMCEWFAFEILNLSTAYISTAHLAAQSLLSTACVLVWHVPFSASVAVSTRIGHLVGSGALDAARKATSTYAVIFALIGLVDAALFVFALREIFLPFFIEDDRVRVLVEGALPYLAAFQFVDATACCCHGIMRGLGRQAIGGWVIFSVNYAFAVPLALYLELGPPKLELNGMWIALGSGSALLTVAEALVTKWMSWQRAVEDARKREEPVVS
ncbi:hypothetical protein H2199_004387 [Coniosporium tulheliwenetii]|uniref:Uncharacterized protein n=1 Tax=Coniosporium tulheliwenetii TaxID=3383036 RepID=A0ACC2Z5M8_9PEZI|nr:hypothetical protein H2199_004387 [Cladosporium sp. JES 115]